MVVEINLFSFTMPSLKQYIEYFHSRCKIQFDLPVQKIRDWMWTSRENLSSKSTTTRDYSQHPFWQNPQNFERKFAACLSSSAVRTKFAQHTTRGRAVVGAVAEIMAEVNAESVALQLDLGTQKKELWDRCDFTEKQLELGSVQQSRLSS